VDRQGHSIVAHSVRQSNMALSEWPGPVEFRCNSCLQKYHKSPWLGVVNLQDTGGTDETVRITTMPSLFCSPGCYAHFLTRDSFVQGFSEQCLDALRTLLTKLGYMDRLDMLVRAPSLRTTIEFGGILPLEVWKEQNGFYLPTPWDLRHEPEASHERLEAYWGHLAVLTGDRMPRHLSAAPEVHWEHSETIKTLSDTCELVSLAQARVDPALTRAGAPPRSARSAEEFMTAPFPRGRHDQAAADMARAHAHTAPVSDPERAAGGVRRLPRAQTSFRNLGEERNPRGRRAPEAVEGVTDMREGAMAAVRKRLKEATQRARARVVPTDAEAEATSSSSAASAAASASASSSSSSAAETHDMLGAIGDKAAVLLRAALSGAQGHREARICDSAGDRNPTGPELVALFKDAKKRGVEVEALPLMDVPTGLLLRTSSGEEVPFNREVFMAHTDTVAVINGIPLPPMLQLEIANPVRSRNKINRPRGVSLILLREEGGDATVVRMITIEALLGTEPGTLETLPSYGIATNKRRADYDRFMDALHQVLRAAAAGRLPWVRDIRIGGNASKFLSTRLFKYDCAKGVVKTSRKSIVEPIIWADLKSLLQRCEFDPFGSNKRNSDVRPPIARLVLGCMTAHSVVG
jgi:hypothetical protein